MSTLSIELTVQDASVVREALSLLCDVAKEDATLSVDEHDKARCSSEAAQAEILLERLNRLM